MKNQNKKQHKKEVAGIFITTFKRKHIEQVGVKVGEKWSEKWSELTERQIMILKLIQKNPRISRKELADKIKINQSAIQKHLENLKKKGLLKRIGPAKGGYWKIIK